MNILDELRRRFQTALTTLDPQAGELAEMVLPSQDTKFGDYQANCAMPLGKRLGQPPREIATQLVEALELDDLCEPPEIAGPGFINLRLKDSWLVERLTQVVADLEHDGIVPTSEPKTYVLDYSSPNVAKPMHVGHIRSTVIGDALYNVLQQLGHRVISDNHIGDWGTQFGMIIFGCTRFSQESEPRTIEVIVQKYRLVNQLIEYHAIKNDKIPQLDRTILDLIKQLDQMDGATIPEDPKEQKKADKKFKQTEIKLSEARKELDSLRSKLEDVDNDTDLSELAAQYPNIQQDALEETAKLHRGDPERLALWKEILVECRKDMDSMYGRLGVEFDNTLGESFYHDRLAGVIDTLTEKGLVQESDGAKCVFLEGIDAPFIVQKKDGAFLYSTTDLATIEYRHQEWSPDAILYVVDHRQSLHFEQLFATVRLSGYTDVELQHVSFGTVLGEDGRPFKTRSGSSVGLGGLLDEAVGRAYRIVCENDDSRDQPLLSDEDRQQVAERIGIGAIKYADLAHNRTSDYVFSYDKMLAMNGNTAAYMQYSYARVRSIFAKGNVDVEQLRGSNAEVYLTEPAERALGLALLRFTEALQRVASDYRPNHLTAYLFELASIYSSFFENCPVLKAESEAVRNSRLLLCDLTARVLGRGLNLLGIETVERM